MANAKYVLSISQLRRALGIPNNVEITHLGLLEDPYALQVYITGDSVVTPNDNAYDDESSERYILPLPVETRQA